MHKQTVWRQQEQQLVERWNAAMERYRLIREELHARPPAPAGAAAVQDELELKAQGAMAEIETLRRQVARLKRAYLSGERY